MTSYYKYLPTKITKRSRCGLRKCHTRQYVFALLLLLTLIFMSLYEFYFTMVERAKNGVDDGNILSTIICQVFMLTVCPKQNNTELLELRSKINELNNAQVIKNFNGHIITDQTIVVVIQVHDRTAYLKDLISSLKFVADINTTLLIFSHDYFNEEINQIVQNIDFAPVMQIFFKFSIQQYPNEFPGTSPNDCQWNMDVAKAKVEGCEGASTPDQYGHFRQAEITQCKHHSWWKMNRVFDGLNITKGFNGYVLFLEEDYYLAPDAIYTLRLMTDFATVECPECNSFHIGVFQNSYSYEQDSNKVGIAPWNSLGFAFNRTLWNTLHACSSVYCTFDDYNWDWSYLYAAQECFFQKQTSLVVHSSRVFHIGDCGGMHHKKNSGCNQSLNEVKELLTSVTPYLFPKSLVLKSMYFQQTHVKKGWGGWSDPRDIQLCLNISH